jgi:hypothetical protein
MPDDNGNGTNLAALQRLLEERTTTISRIGGKLRDARKLIQDLNAERDAAARARDEAAAAAARATKEDAEPARAEVQRLKGELRERDHRAAWERAMAERGVPPDARDLVYRNSGYKAEAETPDAAAILARLEAMAAEPGLSRLLQEAPPPVPPPGSGQGRWDGGAGKFRVTTDQLRDGAWCMANAERLRAARADGTFELVS